MLKVKNAIPIMATPLSAKTHQLMLVRKGNCFNQDCSAQKASGVATMNAKKTIKAYDSKKFLHSTEARPIRILSEYMEPDQRLKRLGINRALIFFGSARTPPGGKPDYYAAAADLAEKIENKITQVAWLDEEVDSHSKNDSADDSAN